jgi:putative spermidine/putrescine transport system permease protein
MSAAVAEAAAPLPPRRRRRRIPRSLLLSAPVVALLCVFFVLPLVLNGIGSVLGSGGGIDVANYVKLLTDPYYLGIVGNTLWVSAIVTCASLAVGYPVALVLVRHAGRWASPMIFLLVAPLLTSTIMRTFGFQVLLARRGLVNVLLADIGVISRPLNVLQQPISVYIGLVHVFAPFMVLSIAAVLQGIDTRVEESARLLGANKLRTFLSITLPLSLDGVATGCILVFMMTNGSFVTMLLLGNGQVVTLPLLIYQQFTLTRDVHFASAMGNLLLLVAIICMVVQLKLIRRRGVT